MDGQLHHACGQVIALRFANGQTYSLREAEQTYGESECEITLEQVVRYTSGEQVHHW